MRATLALLAALATCAPAHAEDRPIPPTATMVITTGLACNTQEQLIEQFTADAQIEGCGMLSGARPHMTIVTPKLWHSTADYELLLAEVMFPTYPAPGIAAYPGPVKWMFVTKFDRTDEPA